MSKLKFYSLFLLIGALSYWLTDIVIHFILRGTDIISLTIVVPIVVTITYFYLRKKIGQQFAVGLPMFMILGIWLFGPLGLAIGAIPGGGTFLESGNLKDFFAFFAIFPLSTFVMSTYSGSMAGLFLTTMLLIIFAMIARKKNIASNKAR
ncbi:MAG: hypothetical protein AB1306_01680 [Nitrospirota bacterium]